MKQGCSTSAGKEEQTSHHGAMAQVNMDTRMVDLESYSNQLAILTIYANRKKFVFEEQAVLCSRILLPFD
ncbi:hypothetical protein Y032_0142g2284 [Ancylostoma ceylanicum]|uniref:Uncharacterized protein n=1 Tax=Ancylostoma ceylanicum TaxID=53326 RepID=A0A016T384_9BILA|nr:hypothetical protein Y032_0142g2284 [Ancylostoma ceylanicum]